MKDIRERSDTFDLIYILLRFSLEFIEDSCNLKTKVLLRLRQHAFSVRETRPCYTIKWKRPPGSDQSEPFIPLQNQLLLHAHDKTSVMTPFDIRWGIFGWLDFETEEYCCDIDEQRVVCDMPNMSQNRVIHLEQVIEKQG